MTRRGRQGAGGIVVDASALQSPMSRGRGIGRYAEQWITGLEAHAPDLVSAYLLDSRLAPPALSEELLATGKFALVEHSAAALESARALHALSPFDPALDLVTIWPERIAARGLARSLTVYDLIPAHNPEGELADPLVRRRYQTRLELVRSAEQLQVISEAVARDVIELLGVRPERISVVRPTPAPHFVPGPPDAALLAKVLGEKWRTPYVLAPAGSHPRKNTERLVEAWGLLPPDVRDAHRLVITGAFGESTVNHYQHLASLGGYSDSLAVTGEVGEAEMVAVLQGAKLVCYPSSAEGFGLPVAEAIACGVPVIASDVAPFDELLEAPARFDPSRPETIGAALLSVLFEPRHLERARAAARRLPSAEHEAAVAAAALERLAQASTPRLPRPLWPPAGRARHAPRRVALVSPFPPAPSGVAGYSYHLAEALVATGEVTVDAFADGPTDGQEAPAEVPVWPAEALESVEALCGHYDAVCYALGNSHHHLGALSVLQRRGGTVLAHDVRLSNLYHFRFGDPTLPDDALTRAIFELYPTGSLPGEVGWGRDISAHDRERYGLLMARDAIAHAEHFLVSSPAAAELARLDARPNDAAKIAVLPFALGVPGLHGAGFDAVGTNLAVPELAGADPLIAHFGIVDPMKQPELLLEACAKLADEQPGLRCAFIGPIAEELAGTLRELAGRLGIAGRLVLSGPLSPSAYLEALSRTAVAVQLRAGFNGEASAAVGECLAVGVPTVVSRTGWARSLPGDAVVALDTPISVAELATAISQLINDPARSAALRRAAQRFATANSFDHTAWALLDVLFPNAPARSARAGRR
ncbi:MAG: glycosyltransferase [Actinomycetota bacterium]|nr:glycosyltransferase [Actinomycetota bacterium]